MMRNAAVRMGVNKTMVRVVVKQNYCWARYIDQ